MADQFPSEQQVLGWMNSLSNWGRWGDDDQRGCLNLVTPSKAKQAAGLVQDGASVSCARPILTEMAADTTFQVQRYMVDSGEGRDTDPPERTLTRRGAAEFIGMVFHGQTITHIDALSHYSWQGKLYNGKPGQPGYLSRGCSNPFHRACRRWNRDPGSPAGHSGSARCRLAASGPTGHAPGPGRRRDPAGC